MKETDKLDNLYDLLDNLTNTNASKEIILQIKSDIANNDLEIALKKIQKLSEKNEEESIETLESLSFDKNKNSVESIFPKKLSNNPLEATYIGLLFNNPKLIARYHFTYKECFFENEELLNLYKSILFTEGEAYAPEIAKKDFSFARNTLESNTLKKELKSKVKDESHNIEDIYINLKKLFILRKHYLGIPIKELQDKIIEIRDYQLYDQMSTEEIENTINQITDTNKFKRSVLNNGLTQFLESNDNTLTNGLSLPFPTLTNVFKGIRKGETMAFAMPSNAGKSRFTINLAVNTAFVHKKKILIISNEMSEEKMKLCLITTILNNSEIKKLHGQDVLKTEGELLEFKFRPDNPKEVETDKDGFVIKQEKETQKNFVARLSKTSSEFNRTIAVTNWVNKEIHNSIHFINITDHTNDELRKVIMNYYYKEKIEYIFYDTLKTDTENIGNSEELKKTATILSNLAQNFNIFIYASLQLAESETTPINLTVNDLAVSRTVKEVLDTLCLVKQISNNTYKNYEYSLNEVDTKFYDLEKFEDPDIRYYCCVVDKNRAGAKPKLLFRLNLAYNFWEELGYIRLKQNGNKE